MRAIIVLLALVTLATAVKQHPVQNTQTVGDKVFLERQKDILKLFRFINQPSYNKEFKAIPYNYPVQNENLYSKPEFVKEFFNFYNLGFLPKGEIFSPYYSQQLKQAIALFKLFYFANDFEVFYKTAAWAREYMNEGLFVYAVSVALVHRPDTKYFTLPPIYEIYPQYFFSSEVIQQAQIYKQQLSKSEQYKQTYVINANYSGQYLNLNKEHVLSYFTEDIGLNAFYYYYNIYYPFWLEELELQPVEQRPLLYGVIYSQILAKYYLERLSNGLGDIPLLGFQYPFYPIETGFYSSLRYPNGLEFPVRPDDAQLTGPFNVKTTPYNFNYTHSVYLLQDYARRISDAIDLGYVISSTGEKIVIDGINGLEILSNIIQGNPNSPNYRYYGSLPRYAKYIFGYSYVPQTINKIVPSVLEQTETALRDPVFYQLYKTISLYIQRYISYQPSYTYKDLELPGVKVQGFEIDRLVTYYDYFYTDITNALYVNEQEFLEDNLLVQVRQERLNHKPFSYKINVQSAQEQEVLVKIFIGPKYDEFNNEINIYENRVNFVLLDNFDYKLQVGQNSIERNSKQFISYLPDRTSYREIYNRVMAGIQEGRTIFFDSGDVYFGLPSRLMLPKGTRSGQTYQLYVYIGPTHQSQALMPVLYPFDRFVSDNAYYVPNAYFKDVIIYLKEFTQPNYTY